MSKSVQCLIVEVINKELGHRPGEQRHMSTGNLDFKTLVIV